MEDPVREIPSIIRRLTDGPPEVQHDTLTTYFSPNAAFLHPICRVDSYVIDKHHLPYGKLTMEGKPVTDTWKQSRWVIRRIYEWYRINSPVNSAEIKSVAFDEENLLVYVTISQLLRIWWLPMYSAPLNLVTVLQLEEGPEGDVMMGSTHPQGSGSGGARQGRSVSESGNALESDEEHRKLTSTGQGGSAQKGAAAAKGGRQGGNKRHGVKTLYYIKSQEDRYQTDQTARIFWFGLWRLMVAFQYFATFLCIVCSMGLRPLGRLGGWNDYRMDSREENSSLKESAKEKWAGK